MILIVAQLAALHFAQVRRQLHKRIPAIEIVRVDYAIGTLDDVPCRAQSVRGAPRLDASLRQRIPLRQVVHVLIHQRDLDLF